MSNVGNFFAGKSVFVTGVTGFVGKVLLEKLLRSCESVESVFVLIRNKRNEDAVQRYKKILNHAVFDKLRATNPDQLSKVRFINGDVSVDGLGLAEEDKRDLIEMVDVVFHCAANVVFDLPLLDILKVNVKGTHRVLELAQQMKKLQAFTFVSTAFSQSYQLDLKETHYPTGYDVKNVLKWIETEDLNALQEVEKSLFKMKHPSTYTMSKAFAEDLVHSYRKTIPVVVVRPSIVVSSNSEPQEGFVEGLHGMTGLAAGGMVGISRNVWARGDADMCVIPVDFAVNTIISAAHQRSLNISSHDCPFYNSSSSADNPLNWSQFVNVGLNVVSKYALDEKSIWYPGQYVTSSFIIYTIRFLLIQMLPSILFDTFSVLSGRKAFMTKLQRKVYQAMIGFGYFTNNTFTLDISNTKRLFSNMNELDQKSFMFDVDKIEWELQIENHIKGIRKFIFKESDETISMAQAKHVRLYWIDIIVKSVLALLFLKFLSNLAVRLLY